jgi:poly(3-hydroxybutyrate) depolymerase
MKSPSRDARVFKLALVCLALSALAAQSDPLPKGTIIERVTCRANANQSYALFLPSNYTADKTWPIIYCFDPDARGRLPLERFKAAAEKYGVIVAGSNNSRNGTSGVAVAVNEMMRDTRERLAIDHQQIYTAGFSGGGRVASAVALSPGTNVAGVIACGGGFPSNVAPSKSVTFALFATAGTEDFNFPEMRRLASDFERLGLTGRLATFEGGHDWLTSTLADEALAWLKLQAIKTSRRAPDEPFITALFDQSSSRIRAAEAAGHPYDAYRGLMNLADDFKGLRDVAEFEKGAAALKGAREVRQAMKQEDEQEREQQVRVKELFMLRGAMKDNDERPLAQADLQKKLIELKKKKDALPASSERIVARRVLDQFFVHLSEEAEALISRKRYGAAVENLTVLTLIAPDNPRLLYNLACAYALNRDRSRALEALRRAIDKGFNDASVIEHDNDLETLHDDAAYKQIVQNLKNRN